MNVKQKHTFESVYKEIDIDGNNFLNENEIKSMCVLIQEKCEKEKVKEMVVEILNSTDAGRKQLECNSSFVIDFDIWKPSIAANNTLASFNQRKKYKHEVEGTEEVAFLMVNNDDMELESKMDGIRKKKHKFVCLNDNLDHFNSTTPMIKQMLVDFYLSLFPHPSSFELPPGKYNEFLYIDHYRELKKQKSSRDSLLNFLFYFVVLLVSSGFYYLIQCALKI